MAELDGYYRVKLPEGTHLANSRNNSDAFRGISLEDHTNKLSGHAELHKVDENEFETASESNEELMETVAKVVGGIVVGVTVTIVAQHCAPRINSWWHSRALPSLKKGSKPDTEVEEGQQPLELEQQKSSKEMEISIGRKGTTYPVGQSLRSNERPSTPRESNSDFGLSE